jgi:hypothetical protein
MKPQQCMLAGVSLPVDDHGVADYDELLREALRSALRIENEGDAFRVLHGRITQLVDAYIGSPAGRGLNPAIMMSSLAVCHRRHSVGGAEAVAAPGGGKLRQQMSNR